MSNTRSVRPWLRIVSAVGAVLFLSATTLPAADYDLIMLGLTASPTPLQSSCSASLSASILINGTEDYTLPSGGAEIRFYWANGDSPMPSAGSTAGWSPAATLPITWAISDGPFAAGREWPTRFPSKVGTSVSWTVPSSLTSVHLRAEAVYTASGASEDPTTVGNNVMTATMVVVEGNCSSGVNCVTIRDELMYCPGFDRDILKVRPEELFCLLDPDCPPRFVDLCEVCPRCCVRFEYDPWEYPWEILIGQPEEVMRLELLFKDKILGVSEPLDEPIRQGGRVYHQVMRLHELPEKDLQYGFKVITGPRAEKDVQYRLNMDRMAARKQLPTGKTAN